MQKKNVLNFTFAAMIVFTVSMMIATILYMKGSQIEVLDDTDLVLPQTDTLKGNIADDATIAVICTDHGDMAAELYSEYAPNAVANFISLAESGYYDGTLVYEIEKGIHLGAGSRYGDGSLPKKYNKKTEKIEPEITDELWPVRGAIMSCGMTRKTFWSGKKIYSGSRFIVSGSIELDDETRKQLGEAQASRVSGLFLEYGGTPNVSKQLTVFAQIFDGWDVLDAILNEETEAEAEMKALQEIAGTETEAEKTALQENAETEKSDSTAESVTEDAEVTEAQDDYIETSKPVKDIEIKTIKIMSYADYKAQTADTDQ